jgi:serine/threonine protein kinase
VYKAVWKGETVAVKVLKSLTITPEEQNVFRSEVKVMKKFKTHPNLIRVTPMVVTLNLKFFSILTPIWLI